MHGKLNLRLGNTSPKPDKVKGVICNKTNIAFIATPRVGVEKAQKTRLKTRQEQEMQRYPIMRLGNTSPKSDKVNDDSN